MHKTTDTFWKCFNKLPSPMQEIAREQFDKLKIDPKHPSLHFKKIGKLWSVRISSFYRALAVKDGDTYVWTWIGTHDEYKMMLRQRQ
jgi:hypothetical protein